LYRRRQIIKSCQGRTFFLTSDDIYYVIYHSKFDPVSKKIYKQAKKENKIAMPRTSDGKPIYTSENKPIAVDIIPESELYLPEKGRIGICMAPGRSKKAKIHEWRRDLGVDLDRIRNEFNCDVFVSLVRHSELIEIDIPNLFDEVEKRGMESIHFPITDKWIPHSMPKLVSLVEVIISKLKESKTVIVHCNGGKGRSGTIVVATLVGLGKKVDSAIKVVRKTRSGTIKNPVQISYLRSFQKAWKRRKKLESFKAGLKWVEEDEDVSEDEMLMPNEKEEYLKYMQNLKKKKKKHTKKKKGKNLTLNWKLRIRIVWRKITIIRKHQLKKKEGI